MILWSTFIFLFLALCFLFSKALSKWQAQKQYSVERARRGCHDPPALPNKDPFGLLRLIEALKAGREERMPQYVASLIDQPGPDVHTIQAKLLNDKMTVTRDPRNVEAIFTTQAQEFDIGPARLECFRPLLGLGLTTVTGEAWKHSRALLRPQFSREQISDMDLEERHIQDLMAILDVSADGWTRKIDLQPLFSNLTHDTATEFLYGQSIESQRHAGRWSNPDGSPFSESDEANEFGHHLASG